MLNIYLTSGTMNFMESLQAKFSEENMIVMHGAGNSILLHETMGKTLFQTPRHYEVIHSFHSLEHQGFFAFNNIPVTEEGKPIFEHRFHNYAESITKFAGLVATRLLRPTNSDTYIVLTQWTTKKAFDQWKKSSNYAQIQTISEDGLITNKSSHIFSSAAYLTTYQGIEDEDDSEA